MFTLIGTDQGDSAANAVNVIFRDVRQVEVDSLGELIDVYALEAISVATSIWILQNQRVTH
ncbi:MAG: hypothetical protein A2W28_05025 [Gammaproteobacteria bacterium RBG_16_51_14]|nr:MAG: hypothetical protein A2W28_05025 [Gammaproteobacteria bacterium RBG_16_51_14]